MSRRETPFLAHKENVLVNSISSGHLCECALSNITSPMHRAVVLLRYQWDNKTLFNCKSIYSSSNWYPRHISLYYQQRHADCTAPSMCSRPDMAACWHSFASVTSTSQTLQTQLRRFWQSDLHTYLVNITNTLQKRTSLHPFHFSRLPSRSS